MSRQRLPIGTHGEITVMNLPDGRVEVRTRYRDFDGKARLVSARAATKSAALAELNKRLAQRHLYQPADTTLTLGRCDVDVTTMPATLRISGTIVTNRGMGTYRQPHPKTDRSNRVIALPTFTAEALRRRLSVMVDRSPDSPVFASREGTPLTTANVRRQLRRVLEKAGITGVHPHMFRRTVATVINDQASVNLAAELLGRTDQR